MQKSRIGENLGNWRAPKKRTRLNLSVVSYPLSGNREQGTEPKEASCQLSGVRSQESVVSCPLSVIRCQLSVVSYPLSVVSCQLSGVRSQLSVVSCPLSVVRFRYQGTAEYRRDLKCYVINVTAAMQPPPPPIPRGVIGDRSQDKSVK